MKTKKVLALVLATIMTFSLAACGTTAKTTETTETTATETTTTADDTTAAVDTTTEATGVPAYADIALGEDYTDLTATIKWYHHKTDREADGSIAAYIAEFNKLYPNIKVETEGVTDYAEASLLYLNTEDWGDVMMIPAIDKNELSNYFLSYGDLATMSNLVNYATAKEYDGQVYGVAYMAGANGIVYNTRVWKEAGITALPTTPDEFSADLKLIADNTDAIPLYTNYAAGWTMGAWDAYANGVCTGDYAYYNQKFAHTANPFANKGDETGAYAVYDILYNAVANGFTEDDFTTTDWESSKGMINRGEIASMVLGSWAYTQMQEADSHPEDIGYMPFPITVGGKQYAVAAPDYCFGINVHSSEENQTASLIFVKWMTEKSGWSYNEGGLPINKDGEYPALYSAFSNCVLQEEEVALEGEDNLLTDINTETELNFNNGGDKKVQEIVECASDKSKTFDEIMDSWNTKWTDAQSSLGIEVLY